jgi:hypothetical protein
MGDPEIRALSNASTITRRDQRKGQGDTGEVHGAHSAGFELETGTVITIGYMQRGANWAGDTGVDTNISTLCIFVPLFLVNYYNFD